MKLGKKLTIIFVALAVIPVLIMGYLAYDVARRTIVDKTINHLVSTNILKASELDRWIESSENSIEELAQRPLVRQYTEQMTNCNSSDPLYVETQKLLVENHFKPRLKYGNLFELFTIDLVSGVIMTSTDERQVGKQLVQRVVYATSVRGVADDDLPSPTATQAAQETRRRPDQRQVR